MHIISRKPFLVAARSHSNQRKALLALHKTLSKGRFENPDVMRRVFPSLDNFKHKPKWWVIDIAGNRLRLIAFIQFSQNRMYVKHIVTQAEYDRLCWRYSKGELV